MVLIKLLCFRLVAPFFKRVHDSLVTLSMQTAVPDIGKGVLSELECPACKQYMVPPIALCQGGHNICNTCRPTVSSCPTCKMNFLESTNISLENLSMQIKFPCRYSKYGCKDTFPYNAYLEHEAVCGYSPQTCPVYHLNFQTNCTWSGISKDVKNHLQTAHKDDCEDYNAQHSLILKRSNSFRCSCKFLFAYNEIFCYRYSNNCYIEYEVLHYNCPPISDSKYQYKFIVKNKDGTESVVVTHLVRSFTESENEMFISKKCLTLKFDHMERFINEKGELLVLMEILRVDD